MRACTFYSPSDQQKSIFHGLELSNEHPFDKPYNAALCCEPELSKNNKYAVCTAETDQPACDYFAPEATTVIKSASIDGKSIILSVTREKFGFKKYIINILHRNDIDNIVIDELHSIRTQDLEESEVDETIEALFQIEYNNTMGELKPRQITGSVLQYDEQKLNEEHNSVQEPKEKVGYFDAIFNTKKKSVI